MSDDIDNKELVADRRAAVDLVEKALGLLNKGKSGDSAVSTIQKTFSYSIDTLPFISDLPSGKRITVVSSHAEYVTELFKRVCARLTDEGLYVGEGVSDAGNFERFVMREFAQWCTSVDGKRVAAVLESLKSAFIQEQQVEVTNRSALDRLFGRKG